MKYLSVCSGIEAASVAWGPLGWEPVGFSEIEPFPSALLSARYPGVPNFGDMTKYATWPRLKPDLLVGGTPCQPFSVAGLRKGLDDPRGNLMLTYGAIAAKYRPRWLVWENVPGVLSSNGGYDFAALLGLLTGQRVEPPEGGWRNAGVLGGIRSAYAVAWRVLDAQYVRVESHARAVPQRRRRVFLVGHLGDWRRAAAVLFERESLRGDSAPRRAAGKGATYDVAPCVAASGRGIKSAGDTRGQDCVIATPTGIVPCMAFPARLSGTQCASAEGISPSLGAANEMAVAFSGRARGDDGRGYSRPPQVFESGAVGAIDTVKPHCVAVPYSVRRLTPRECERLQGFPDGYTAIDWTGWRSMDDSETPEACREAGLEVKQAKTGWRVKDADGPRYKALGNSMATNVMQWIGLRIAMVETIFTGPTNTFSEMEKPFWIGTAIAEGFAIK